MSLNIQKSHRSDDIIVKLTAHDVSRRLEGAVFDLIAIKLADKYVQEHGDFLLHDLIDVASLKEEVTHLIKERITYEVEQKVSKA